MNILFVNTLYDGGGAENICRQLREYLNNKKDTNVVCLVGNNKRKLNLTDNGVYVVYSNLLLRLYNRFVTKNHNHSSYSIKYTRKKIEQIVRKYNIDLIHIHNGHGNYIGIEDLGFLSSIAPVVWTIHDFWTVTGHCACPLDCKEWMRQCSNCPRPNQYPPVKNVKKIEELLLLKKINFCNKGIHFVAPSIWVGEQVKKGILQDENICVIENAIELSKWTSFSKDIARKKLKIPENKKILAIISAQISVKWKGIATFIESLKYIKNIDEYHIIFAGASFNFSEILDSLKVSYSYLGFLKGSELNYFYSAADVLINPSIAETFGLVSVEAMACGTPVIAFDICAMSEIIDKNCGWLVKNISAEGLANKINDVFNDVSELNNKAVMCRKYVEQKYDINQMVCKYYSLYRNILRKDDEINNL